jgi:putative spermidine/putrescine transport system ATP-binding protein
VIGAAMARDLFGLTGTFAVRPEKVSLDQRGASVADGALRVDGVVREVVYAGSVSRVVVDTGAGLALNATVLNASAELDATIRRGTEVTASWPASALRRIAD